MRTEASDIFTRGFLTDLANDIRFHEDLMNDIGIEKQIYFDTSSIIDILLGFESLLKEMGESHSSASEAIDGLPNNKNFQRKLFNQPHILVHAMAYLNWLGPISTLPPHTDELVNKIQLSKHTLRDTSGLNEKVILEKLRSGLGLDFSELKQIVNNKNETRNILKKSNLDTIKFFKLTYLFKGNTFWKNRYQYLRHNSILNFSPTSNFDLKAIVGSTLYHRLHEYFNTKRAKDSINNYIDVLALCCLDRELKNFQLGNKKGQNIPLFYSDQPIILEAVVKASKIEDEDGRHPFTWISSTERPHLVVRGANFFIMWGMLNVVKGKDGQQEIIKASIAALDDYNQSEMYTDHNWDTSMSSDDNNYTHNHEFMQRLIDTGRVEFFNRWRLETSEEEMKKLISSVNFEELDGKIEAFIYQERKRLAEQFSKDSDRFKLIKKLWDDLDGLPTYVKNKFTNTSMPLDAFNEIDARFAVSEDICHNIQSEIDYLFDAFKSLNDQKVRDVVSRIIDAVLIGLYDDQIEKKKKDVYLTKGIGFLWVLEKYKLVSEICYTVKDFYIKKYGKGKMIYLEDAYPTHAIALLHAASLMHLSSHNRKECIQIMECVGKKHGMGNYQIWTSFSYINFLLWNSIVNSFDFSELIKLRNQHRPAHALDFLRKAGEYAQHAVNWLINARLEGNEKDEIQSKRRRRYYYALNNLLFYIIIHAPQKEFLEARSMAKELEETIYNRDFRHYRYWDTLSRYYYRLAFVSETQPDFDLYLKWAIEYNKKALAESHHNWGFSAKLQKDLEEIQIKGFECIPGKSLPAKEE